jgi:hypothetical protein
MHKCRLALCVAGTLGIARVRRRVRGIPEWQQGGLGIAEHRLGLRGVGEHLLAGVWQLMLVRVGHLVLAPVGGGVHTVGGVLVWVRSVRFGGRLLLRPPGFEKLLHIRLSVVSSRLALQGGPFLRPVLSCQ